MNLRTWYNKDANYQTNAKSFMDYLARTNKFLEVLIEDYELFQELVNEELERIKFDSEMAVDDILYKWLEDGTLARIINDGVLGNKADKSEVQDVIQQLLTKADKAEIQDILQELQTKASQEDLNNVSQDVDSLNQSLANSEQDLLNQMNQRKKKSSGYIFIADYDQLPNERDDQFINRVLQEIPVLNTDTGYREGILVLEAKEYILEDSIRLGQYQQLEGSGRSTRLLLENSTKPIIHIDAGNNSSYGNVIKNISLFGSNINTGISIYRATHLYMENVYIYNVEMGIDAQSVWLGHFNRVSIRNYHSMGEYGIRIRSLYGENLTSTSLLFSNTWVKNFKRGYDVGTALYSTFNATACDTFTHYAYNGGSAVTYNSAGAEDGQLIDNGFVFGAGARQTVYNTPNVMAIKYSGINNAYIFSFDGTPATINGFRWQSGDIPDNLLYMNLQNQAQVNLYGSYFPSSKSGRDRFNFGHQHSSVFEQSHRLIRHYDRFTMNTISDLTTGV